MTRLLQYEWCFLSASRRSLAEELALSSRFVKNLILTLHQCCLIDWLIIMGVCSISEDSKEARPHYGVPHTKQVLTGNTESHGLCFVRLRCERGRRVLSFLAEKNSRPKHEIRYTRLVLTKIANYLMCRVIMNHPPDRHHQRQRIHLVWWVLENGSYPSTCGSNGFSFSTATMEASITSGLRRQQRLPTISSATLWAPHGTASPWWCYIEVVLYRAPPQALPFTNNN